MNYYDVGLTAAQAGRPNTAWYSLSQEGRISAICEKRDAGLKRHEIAAALGVPANSLWKFCERHRIGGLGDANPRLGRWHAMQDHEERLAEINRLSENNFTIHEAAVSLGVTVNTLRGFMWRAGLRAISAKKVAPAQSAAAVTPPLGGLSRFRPWKRPPASAFVPARPVDPKVWNPIHGDPVDFEHNSGCCWPIDTPDGQRYCGAKKGRTSDGKRRHGSYCTEHAAIAGKPARAVGRGAENTLSNIDNQRPRHRAPTYTPDQTKAPVRRNDDE